jgi:Zn-dependent M28 family amino/carboxypeptidase
MKNIVFVSLIALAFLACKPNNQTIEIEKVESMQLAEAPIFNEDSAFAQLEKQLSFGPRVPNTAAHQEAANYLQKILGHYADTLIVQKADLKAYDGTILKASNIIGSFNLTAQKRILLAAHWDTRPFADQDEEGLTDPILGANDGASGVAVLLEIARQLQLSPPETGIDIILFDAEDYGQPAFSEDPFVRDSYCLGSQYWSKNPHIPNYQADFGILLDMVGAPNALFTHEGTSVNYANEYLHKVWSIAHALGYNSYFSYLQTNAITDDHLYVNAITGIPMIDIIQHDASTNSGFGWYWHTHDDNLDAIDKRTLKAVGQTVLQTIYQENQGL